MNSNKKGGFEEMDIILIFTCMLIGIFAGIELALSEIATFTAEKVSYILDRKHLVLRREKNVDNQ